MGRYSQVLVGYDGTKESERALRWAVEEARRRRLPLTVCHAWRWPYPISYIDYEGAAIIKRMGENLLRHGTALAQNLAPGVPVRHRLMDGPTASALLHHADDGLIVIGSHEQSELPVGSSALQIPARARCPVMVVRDPAQATEGRVVAGVDGSAGGEAALEFAFEEAALRGWRLDAVHGCWEPASVADSEIALFADKVTLEHVCGARLQRAVAPWLVKCPQVSVRTFMPMEEPRRALLDAAEGADLIVVGDRGEGGLHPQLLGATTLAMLQLSPCTVAVVHPLHRT
ncbi:Nucleotide-binding universal stress protein, UspA family [Thermomonospora echinospora]|uniref:Nucleotide-binding universal stress protein, UspA family n=1 Tax=Thermomonospora echinospora TaxID=1992 RepID=A0A1H6DRS0_9ACTN|nr:universal stress protein [Thermomonospora echinospora]SEG88067.1 Nucleotide-binding universal stress protein, UspA family [Thermomonospora echinospora]